MIYGIAIFRSCSKQQKASYDLLVTKLRRRFTPVHIQSVQTSLFRDRRQCETEQQREMERQLSLLKALVDTGSPSTMVLLDFLLKVLAKQKKIDESPEEWRDRMRGQMEPPGPRLNSYGGVQLNTVCQIKVDISRGNYKTVSTVQVQKEAPIDLLLGTDLHSPLGFFLF